MTVATPNPALSQTNYKGVDAPESFCYNHTSLTDGALLEKENAPPERKSIDSRKRFCYKVWLAGQFFATEYSPAGKRAAAQVPNKAPDTQLRIDPLDRLSEKNLETFS